MSKSLLDAPSDQYGKCRQDGFCPPALSTAGVRAFDVSVIFGHSGFQRTELLRWLD